MLMNAITWKAVWCLYPSPTLEHGITFPRENMTNAQGMDLDSYGYAGWLIIPNDAENAVAFREVFGPNDRSTYDGWCMRVPLNTTLIRDPIFEDGLHMEYWSLVE